MPRRARVGTAAAAGFGAPDQRTAAKPRSRRAPTTWPSAASDVGEGLKISSSFLHNATLALFEQHGFERSWAIGKTRWVVRRVI